MIIPALVRLYDRLIEENDETVAPKGYSRQQISFKVVLNKNGTLHEFEPVSVTSFRESKRKVKGVETIERKEEQRPAPLLVPGQSKPTGSGLNPCFLWDNAAYMIGFKADDPKPARTREAFEKFREKHIQCREQIKDDGFRAVCKFLESWKPSDAKSHKELADLTTNFGVFQIRGDAQYVHDREAVREWWGSQGEGESEEAAGDVVEAPSLTDGRRQPIARLHEPKIKGVAGAQSAGATLVSFNQSAFTSYGKDQGANAPVSADDAFKYCTALNRLTTDDARRVRIAGDTIVFWSEGGSKVIESWFAAEMSGGDPAEEARELWLRVREGKSVKDIANSRTPFYILGLSPNMARLSVRLWMVSSTAEIVARLHTHAARLLIVRKGVNDEVRAPSFARLLASTARCDKDGKIDFDTIDPALSAPFARAVLAGSPWPTRFLSQIISRVQSEANIDAVRAAAVKGYLLSHGEDMNDVYVNKMNIDKAYQCGRMLAVLAFAQDKALGTVNAGIVRRNLGAVMSSPSVFLPRLQRNAEVAHYPKCQGDVGEYCRDRVKEISCRLQDSLPATLSARQQGRFLLGFYQEERWLELEAEPVSKRHRYRTTRGEWVRSKSEVRVANLLHELDIPYIYEARALLADGRERWPDFYIQHSNEAESVFIEFLGVADNAEYDKTWSEKVAAYAAHGVTVDGGPKGKLIILDYRSKPFDELAIRRQVCVLTADSDMVVNS